MGRLAGLGTGPRSTFQLESEWCTYYTHVRAPASKILCQNSQLTNTWRYLRISMSNCDFFDFVYSHAVWSPALGSTVIHTNRKVLLVICVSQIFLLDFWFWRFFHSSPFIISQNIDSGLVVVPASYNIFPISLIQETRLDSLRFLNFFQQIMIKRFMHTSRK